MNQDTQQTVVELEPKRPLFDQEAFKARMKDLGPADLVEVFDGLVAASNALQGIVNRPRTQQKAERELELLLEELGGAYSAIVNEVESREITGDNALALFHICAAYEVHCEGSPIALASIAVRYAEASTI